MAKSKIPEEAPVLDESSTSSSEPQETSLSDPTIEALNSLSSLLTNPEELLHTLLLPPSEKEDEPVHKEHKQTLTNLEQISKALFGRMEQLAKLMEETQLKLHNQEEEVDDAPLSNLNELYFEDMDPESIWAQVDLQNEALVEKVKGVIKKLSKKTDNTRDDGEFEIRLLNMSDVYSDGDDEQDDSEVDSEEDPHDDSEDDSDEEEEDETARRARERMERIEAEMDDMDSDMDDMEEENPRQLKQKEEEEDLYDEARENLNDGFFDLHEMEAFADEEEEMLPDEAYGEPQPDDAQKIEQKRKNLPHLKNRAGSDDDSEDEEFKELEKNVEPTIRRKKYREDDDVNALAAMYDENEEDDDEWSDDEDNVVNLTAADFFGKPRKASKEYISRLKKEKEQKKTATADDDSDADSWDNHDFGQDDGTDWRGGDDDDEIEKEAEEDNENDSDSNDDDSASDSDDDSDDDEDEKEEVEENKKLSGYQERSKKLNSMTEDMEKEVLSEKPWQMLGEAISSKRPENSLLEMTPEFEFATKQAPIITQEHTESIEEMIKRRVIEEDWDDVVPRELPDIGLDKRNGELPEVSQEKSKLSLGELYEREYLKKATGYDKDTVEKETEEEKARSEMRALFANICSKLDALSNYHFAPRPVSDEADVKTENTPAIAMEEVLPLYVSDAKAMAPEEIFDKKKGRDGILRGESEMDQADRKRLRHAKKAARRKARKAKLADEKLISRLQPELGLNNPYEKRKLREELQMARASGKVIQGEREDNADFKTSAKFFQKMQDDVHSEIRGDESSAGKKRKHKGEESTRSSKFKL